MIGEKSLTQPTKLGVSTRWQDAYTCIQETQGMQDKPEAVSETPQHVDSYFRFSTASIIVVE
jgi:hypothetical protein